ncbi:MAG: Uma2 family endonuclease [Gammaproteobacteria bacterium]|nr:Uma2 family endonuclease [Gammaproteobacteria bacterium]
MNKQVLTQPLAQCQQEPYVTLYGVAWEQYETLVATFMDRSPSLRMTYLAGTLQIMTTSSDEHEWLKKIIARLLEAYAEEMDIDLNGYGAATFRKKAKKRGLEPDECYCFGRLKEVPDIAIEIVITSGDVDKLAVYQGLEVPEVWFWKHDQFFVYHLCNKVYEQATRSRFLPELDLSLLAAYVDCTNQTRTAKSYRTALSNL